MFKEYVPKLRKAMIQRKMQKQLSKLLKFTKFKQESLRELMDTPGAAESSNQSSIIAMEL